MPIPELHGRRGLTAHEVLEQRLAIRERSEQLMAAWRAFVESVKRAMRSFVQGACEVFERWFKIPSVKEILEQLAMNARKTQCAHKPKFSRQNYWSHQRARLERLEQRGQLLSRQQFRLSLARANA